MTGELVISHGADGWAFDLPKPPPLGRLLAGKTPAEAADLLARLFNLCGASQGMAARLSAGLQVSPDAMTALARDVLRDHLLALFVTLPRDCGLPPTPLPADWQATGDLSHALWGGPRPAVLDDWLHSGAGRAPLARALRARFPGRTAAAPPLPFACAANMDDDAETVENSPAMRHANDPLLQQADAAQGRGPLWRLLGRICDAEDAARGALPAPVQRADGMALVPAARGVYALRLHVQAGRVSALARRTPTDHMLAQGGTLCRALDGVHDPALARLVVAVHDPCLPTRIAEPAHA
ncbi:hydrogenase expression/formation protein HupK [Roseovarius sp.]|uniref:hydrogenase expression/formation protein HupK n=1 Tax=Roseovarius sp. TaxID=1486281 RepID=UPI003562F036